MRTFFIVLLVMGGFSLMTLIVLAWADNAVTGASATIAIAFAVVVIHWMATGQLLPPKSK